MSQQGYVQKSVRAATGKAETLNGDWLRLFDSYSIPLSFTSGGGMTTQYTFNERLLLFLNARLVRTFTSLPEAQHAYAVAKGAANWSSLGSFTP